jgi:hypothetical protein
MGKNGGFIYKMVVLVDFGGLGMFMGGNRGFRVKFNVLGRFWV